MIGDFDLDIRTIGTLRRKKNMQQYICNCTCEENIVINIMKKKMKIKENNN